MAPEKRKEFVEQLLKQQRDNGGWAQKPDMKPDAYATGSVSSLYTKWTKFRATIHCGKAGSTIFCKRRRQTDPGM
jgi:hypothetical protein